MFKCYLPDTPPETFKEMLWRLEMTEEQFFDFIDEKEAERSEYEWDNYFNSLN